MRVGYLHNISDVKILILFLLERVKYPVNTQQIYELCYLDESLSYFDVVEALPQMVSSGHLRQVEEECYAITDKGRQDGEVICGSLPFTIRQKAEDAVDKFNRQVYRSAFVKTDIRESDNGSYAVTLKFDDEFGNLMKLDLMAPSRRQAMKLSHILDKKAEAVYNLVMAEILDDEDEMQE